jgi:hypothetical protein
MSFDPARCVIPRIYCGNRNALPNGYSRFGLRAECLRQGFGAGMFQEREKTLARNSLQRIKYVGDVFERNFRREGITNVDDLLEVMGNLREDNRKRLLKRIFTKANGTFDGRGYNSTLLWLHNRGMRGLPKCKRLIR